MEKQNVLRLIFKQPTAHYRVGFTQMNIHRTLPLPPPSTIIGFIHKIMECKDGDQINGFDIAICGGYESIFYQYQIFRNIRGWDPSPSIGTHPGSKMPNQVQLLHNVYLRIYLQFDHFDLDAPRFMEKLNNPAIPFILGRREDLAILQDMEIKPSVLVKKDLPQRLELNYWVPETTVEDFNVHGPVYLLGTYYQLQENSKKKTMRNFERKRFYYVEPQPLNPIKVGKQYTDPQGWVDSGDINDTPAEIPVFFLGVNQRELSQ